MKTKLFTLLAFTIFVSSNAQLTEHSLTTTAYGATCAHAVDFDNDEDMDVLSASRDDDTISWFKNEGDGVFGPEQIITTDVIDPYYAYAADIDGDGDMDALSASQVDDTIAWYENTDGQGTFGPKQIITNIADFAQSLYAEDLDDDDDMDVLSASGYDQKIAWYENVNGDGTVWEEHPISTEADGAWSVYTADLDGDDDPDVLSASFYDHKIAWYENTDGLGTFGEQQLITEPSNTWGARFVRTGDLDNDGDQDIVSASRTDNKIAWYENLGSGDFGDINTNQNVLTDQATFTTSVSVVQFNNYEDGDAYWDVLFNSLEDHKIFVMLGDGNGGFGEEHVLTSEAERNITTEAVDINDDGILDVLSSNWESNQIAWYEGEILSVNENTMSDFSVYPSPTSGIINIQSKTNIVQIEIYNQLGQLVSSNSDLNTIDISNLNQGVYFIKIMDEQGALKTQKVMKK